MQHLDVSGAVRTIYGSLGVKRLRVSSLREDSDYCQKFYCSYCILQYFPTTNTKRNHTSLTDIFVSTNNPLKTPFYIYDLFVLIQHFLPHLLLNILLLVFNLLRFFFKFMFTFITFVQFISF